MRGSICGVGLGLTLLLSSCGPAGDSENLKGKMVKEHKQIAGVKGVVFKAPGTLFITQSAQESFEVEADEGTQGRLAINSEKGILTIDQGAKGWKGMFLGTSRSPSAIPISYFLNINELDSISINGSGEVTVEGLLKGEKLDASISGSGVLHLDFRGAALMTSISGAGRAFLSGEVEKQRIVISGSGKFEGEKLKSQQAEVNISGSGEAALNVRDQLKVSISGSGYVSYRGHPQVEESISGSGSIKKVDR